MILIESWDNVAWIFSNENCLSAIRACSVLVFLVLYCDEEIAWWKRTLGKFVTMLANKKITEL